MARSIDKKNIEKSVFKAVDEVNALLPRDHRLKKTPDVGLSGKGGQLDSLGLVNLIVATERKIEEDFGLRITLVDERAMSQKKSPFRTVKTLIDYIELLLREKKNGRK